MLTGDVPFHGENQVSVAMKHVREDMPDLQARRPEASATLASVLDRMTDKDLKRRYPDIDTLVADLEEALAIEAARTGHSTGEATAVLRTLPPSARRRLPFRMRHPLPVAAIVLLLVIGASLVVLLLKEGVDRTERGTGAGDIEAPAGERVVSVASTSAKDYDPLGDDDEHPERAPLVVDRQPDTRWITESYSSGIEGANKDGVGIYVDAKPGVEAVRMEIQSPETGWRAEIFGASGSRVPEGIDAGWKRLGGGEVRSDHQRFRLADSGERYRYYLVWITELPPDAQRVEIGEIALLRSADGHALERSWPERSDSKRSSAKPSRRSHSSAGGTPLASHSFGNALVAVKPGIVLSSLTSTRSSSTKKSTRARPAQPTRLKVSTASRRTSSLTVSGSRAGTTSSIPPSSYLAV